MYIAVIPLARSLHPRPYTYFVTTTWSDVPIDSIKPIISVISSIPLLPPYILAAILSIASRYSLPMHKALALFFPVPLQSRLDKKNYLFENIL